MFKVWPRRKAPRGIRDLLVPMLSRMWCRRTGGQLKTWITIPKEDLESKAMHDGEKTGCKLSASSHRIVVPLSETWSIPLMMPA